jgi:hypothetical protein
VLAAWRTIRATTQSADREVKASQAQTAVAQQQIETSLRLDRRRVAREGYAFQATIWAAMERVLLEASEAKSKFLSAGANERTTTSRQAYEARQNFSKGAFPELRSACVRYGGRITRDLLELESDIDKFRSQWAAPQNEVRVGLHAGFDEQLGAIEAKATYLHGEAVAGMERANAVIVETDPDGG